MGDIMESKISIITNIETNYKGFTKTEKIIEPGKKAGYPIYSRIYPTIH